MVLRNDALAGSTVWYERQVIPHFPIVDETLALSYSLTNIIIPVLGGAESAFDHKQSAMPPNQEFSHESFSSDWISLRYYMLRVLILR